jgi:hypothetical protein
VGVPARRLGINRHLPCPKSAPSAQTHHESHPRPSPLPYPPSHCPHGKSGAHRARARTAAPGRRGHGRHGRASSPKTRVRHAAPPPDDGGAFPHGGQNAERAAARAAAKSIQMSAPSAARLPTLRGVLLDNGQTVSTGRGEGEMRDIATALLFPFTGRGCRQRLEVRRKRWEYENTLPSAGQPKARPGLPLRPRYRRQIRMSVHATISAATWPKALSSAPT